MSEDDSGRLERLNSTLKRRGFLAPAFEIHGGAKGLYDFGPVGGRLRSRVIQSWIDHWLQLGNVVEVACPAVTPFAVLEASGHVGEFSDFMTTCNSCEEASRADTLLEASSKSRRSQPRRIEAIAPICQSFLSSMRFTRLG